MSFDNYFCKNHFTTRALIPGIDPQEEDCPPGHSRSPDHPLPGYPSRGDPRREIRQLPQRPLCRHQKGKYSLLYP